MTIMITTIFFILGITIGGFVSWKVTELYMEKQFTLLVQSMMKQPTPQKTSRCRIVGFDNVNPEVKETSIPVGEKAVTIKGFSTK